MQLYILRHGIAFERHEWAGSDDSRPLTAEGMEKTREVVKALKERRDLAVDAIWSSPLVRALQTATIAGEVLGQAVVVVEALASGASLQKVLKYASTQKLPEKLMWVGHEPDCSIMTGQLVGDPDGAYEFKKAGMASLNGTLNEGGMKLEWLIAPKDVL